LIKDVLKVLKYIIGIAAGGIAGGALGYLKRCLGST